jgi:hypothetical protein
VKVSESVGCSAAHALVAATVHEALDDEIAESGSASSGRWSLYLVARALRDPSQIATGDLLWDDVSTPGNTETRDEILLRAIGVAATHLALTGTPDTWQWGRLHTLTLRSIFDSFGVTTYNDGPHAAPGGLFTVNVASPSTRVPDEGKPCRLLLRPRGQRAFRDRGGPVGSAHDVRAARRDGPPPGEPVLQQPAPGLADERAHPVRVRQKAP